MRIKKRTQEQRLQDLARASAETDVSNIPRERLPRELLQSALAAGRERVKLLVKIGHINTVEAAAIEVVAREVCWCIYEDRAAGALALLEDERARLELGTLFEEAVALLRPLAEKITPAEVKTPKFNTVAEQAIDDLRICRSPTDWLRAAMSLEIFTQRWKHFLPGAETAPWKTSYVGHRDGRDVSVFGTPAVWVALQEQACRDLRIDGVRTSADRWWDPTIQRVCTWALDLDVGIKVAVQVAGEGEYQIVPNGRVFQASAKTRRCLARFLRDTTWPTRKAAEGFAHRFKIACASEWGGEALDRVLAVGGMVP